MHWPRQARVRAGIALTSDSRRSRAVHQACEKRLAIAVRHTREASLGLTKFRTCRQPKTWQHAGERALLATSDQYPVRAAFESVAAANLPARVRQTGAAMRRRELGFEELPATTLRAGQRDRALPPTERRIKAAKFPVTKSLHRISCTGRKLLKTCPCKSAAFVRRERAARHGVPKLGRKHDLLNVGDWRLTATAATATTPRRWYAAVHNSGDTQLYLRNTVLR